MTTEARDIIRRDVEIMRKLDQLVRDHMDYQMFSKKNPGLKFGTTEWHYYVAEYRKQIEPQVQSLREQLLTFNQILDLIRSLPREDAAYLLNAYCWKVDGDRGYGSWPNPDKEPTEWYYC